MLCGEYINNKFIEKKRIKEIEKQITESQKMKVGFLYGLEQLNDMYCDNIEFKKRYQLYKNNIEYYKFKNGYELEKILKILYYIGENELHYLTENLNELNPKYFN